VAAPDNDRGSLAPFVAAVAIVAVVLVAVAVLTLTRGDGLTEEQRVGRAAVGQNDALQRENYPDYRRYTCHEVQGGEAEVLAAQRASTRQRGARYVDDVADVKIGGDRAGATVTYHFGNFPDAKRTTSVSFAREDGSWKVCSPYR
jgi:hypothetical protein